MLLDCAFVEPNVMCVNKHTLAHIQTTAIGHWNRVELLHRVTVFITGTLKFCFLCYGARLFGRSLITCVLKLFLLLMVMITLLLLFLLACLFLMFSSSIPRFFLTLAQRHIIARSM